MLPRLVVAEQE